MTHWKTILWLRWRLTRNQWSRRGAINEAAGIVLAALITVAMVLSCVVGFLLGARWLAGASSEALLLAWDGVAVLFLFFWMVGVLTDLQRGESLDLGKLLHLPISLGHVFLLNYVASWLTPSLFVAVPGFVCLAVGVAVGRGEPMSLWQIPVVLAFFFWVTAVTYLLRGWLVAFMSNERRRRAILVVASVVAVLFIQAPNFYFNVLRQRIGATELPAWFEQAHGYVPPLWVAAAANQLSAGRLGIALAVVAGGILLGVAALGLSYRATVRFYRGGTSLRRRPASAREREVRASRLIERRLPWLSDEATAIVLGTLRSHLRAPEVKMALFGQLLMNVAFGFVFLRPGGMVLLQYFQSATGAMIALLSLFGAVQIFFNQFGFDREGFRLFVISPVRRANILLGKNLAAFPLVSLAGVLVLGLALGFRLIGPTAFVAAILIFCSGYLIFSTVGNWLSIVSPYRMASGSLKPTKVPPKVTLLIFVGMLLSPVMAGILFLPTVFEFLGWYFHWNAPFSISLAGACALTVLSVGVYILMLEPLGRLLERREQEVLLAVTREIE